MSFRFIIIAIIGPTIDSVCLAQSINPHFDQYNFENGLSSNRVQCLAQDSDGFLWIGTETGLNRFDGNSFVHYYKQADGKSIADNLINDIICLPGHKLAIATVSGLSFLDTHADTFFTFRYADTSKLSIEHNYFKTLCLDGNGNLWAGTSSDIFVFDPGLHLIRTISSGYTANDIGRKVITWIWKLTALPDGHILADGDHGYDIYDIHSYQSYHLQDHPESRWTLLPQTYPRIYNLDSLGHLWFVHGPVDSLFSYDWKQHALVAYPLFKGASSHFYPVGNIFSFSSRLAYIYLSDEGLFILHTDNGKSTIQQAAGIPSNSETAIFFHDHQNNLWFGTSNGLYELSPLKNQFQTFLFPHNDKNATSADNNFITRIDNDLWIGSYGNGIYRFNLLTQNIQNYLLSFKSADMSTYTWNIHSYQVDTLLIGTLQGLIWFNSRNATFGRLLFSHPAILDTFPITTQFKDRSGLVWLGVGAGHGVICFNPEKKQFRVYDPSQFPLRHPTAITEDENDNLWMATQKGGGLVEWNRSADQFTIVHSTASTPFVDEGINSLCADQHGHLWIGSASSGLVCYDLKNREFTAYGKENGLSYERIDEINGATYPYLWVITAFGLNRFNIVSRTFESFYKKDGLPTDELSSGNYFDSTSGKMYLGWKSAVVQFDALHFSTNENSPEVFINKVVVNDELEHSDLKRTLSLTYSENNLTIDFTAVDLVNGSDLTFRYRLRSEKKWKDLDKNRQIHFSNLPPGNYSLLIQAANKSGRWNENSTALNFLIQSPFWETGWFYALVAVASCVAIYSLYRFRIKQIQRVQEMRNRIAQDLHDDIGGTMTVINLTNELAMQRLNDPPLAKKLMKTISEDLSNMGETLDDIVWMVNPKNDSIEEVIARMRRYASRTWETAGIDCTISFDNVPEKVRLNMEARHDLYLVFKEAVNNVAKHAMCKHVSSSLRLYDHSLYIEVKDDGEGFDIHAPSFRNGLGNMQSRMMKWNGDFKIQSSNKEGTTVSLRLPITQNED